MDSITHVQLEHEFSEYRRQSEHTIKELEKQVQVAVMMITQANNDNEELIDQIHIIQKELKDSNNRPTPEPQPTIATLVCTPRKAAVNPRGPAHRLLSDDTTGSFIGQTTVPTVTHLAHSPVSESSSVHGKRNLSFNTSGGDTTRRSGGTDSGINTSDGNEVMIQEDPLSGSGAGMLLGGQHDTVPRHERPRKRKRVRRYIARLLCCGTTTVTNDEAQKSTRAKIIYKKM